MGRSYGGFSTVVMIPLLQPRAPRRGGWAARGPPARRGGGRGAATQLPGPPFTDLRVGRVGVAVEQRPGGHHHARRTETALQSVLLHEALLHWVEHAVGDHALDGAHLTSVGHGREDRARLDGLTVHVHDTRATVARV